jgi:maltose O-acetyltransferase
VGEIKTNISWKFYIGLYYILAINLPVSYRPYFGRVGSRIRYLCCKHIFAKCGEHVNIERGVEFIEGAQIEIGDRSRIGLNSRIQLVTIGKDVLIGPEVIIFSRNHIYSDPTRPINTQGLEKDRRVIIEDDVWVGARSIILPGRRIGIGAVIGAGSVVTKNVPEYAVVGGNPAKILKYRTPQEIFAKMD